MHPDDFASPWSKWVGPLLAFVFVAALTAIGARVLWRRDAGPDVAPVREPQADELTQITECFSAVHGERSDIRRIPLRRKPLKRWSEPTENVSEAAIWAWGERGRPYALVAMEHHDGPGRDEAAQTWSFELVLLANEPMEVEGSDEVRAMNATSAPALKPVLGGTIHWTPKPPGLTFCDVPDAPAPAQTAEARLLQMKDVVKRFSAVVHGSELRLVPDPDYRYSDLEAGQLDGAIYFFSIGTNPEVMVLLEAQGPTPDKASWRYAVAPATVAAFEVAIDGKKVWAKRYHSEKDNTPSGSYFVMGMPRLKR